MYLDDATYNSGWKVIEVQYVPTSHITAIFQDSRVGVQVALPYIICKCNELFAHHRPHIEAPLGLVARRTQPPAHAQPQVTPSLRLFPFPHASALCSSNSCLCFPGCVYCAKGKVASRYEPEGLSASDTSVGTRNVGSASARTG